MRHIRLQIERSRAILALAVLLLAVYALLFSAPSYAEPETFIVVSPKKIESDKDLYQWFTYYYLHKDASLVVPAVRFLALQKVFDTEAATPPVVSFLGCVFSQNPDKVEKWVKELDDLDLNQKQFLWVAVGLSGSEKANALLKKLAERNKGEAQTFLNGLVANKSVDIFKTEITQPAHLDMLWGQFMATGDTRTVGRVVQSLVGLKPGASQDKTILAGAARWSLVANAKQHPTVLKYLKESLPSFSPFIQSELKRIISEVEQPKPVVALAPPPQK